jgi:hypothetical protein
LTKKKVRVDDNSLMSLSMDTSCRSVAQSSSSLNRLKAVGRVPPNCTIAAYLLGSGGDAISAPTSKPSPSHKPGLCPQIPHCLTPQNIDDVVLTQAANYSRFISVRLTLTRLLLATPPPEEDKVREKSGITQGKEKQKLE